MSGMNRRTGHKIDDDVEHIRQSVADILTTPVGTRIQRREYGSFIPELIDQPGNPANRLRLMAATVMAIIRWEPRITPNSTIVTLNMEGKATVEMEAVRKSGPRAGSIINLAIPL